MHTGKRVISLLKNSYVAIVWYIPDWLLMLVVGFLGGLATNILTGGNYSEEGVKAIKNFCWAVGFGTILIRTRIKVGNEYQKRRNDPIAKKKKIELSVDPGHPVLTTVFILGYTFFILFICQGFRDEFANNAEIKNENLIKERKLESFAGIKGEYMALRSELRETKTKNDSLLKLLGARQLSQPGQEKKQAGSTTHRR